jgi:hypothetical protein
VKAIRPSKTHGEVDTRLDQHKKTVEGYERLHVQVTQQQYRYLKRIAYERNISLAEVVRQAVGSWLESQ